MLVKDVMNPAPLHVSGEQSLQEAVTLMAEHQQSCLLVTQDNRPCGIVTERDLTLAFAGFFTQEEILPNTISDIMTCDPVCIQDDLAFEEALALSRSRKLRHLPVINDSGLLEGIVTQSTLLEAFAKVIDDNSELEQSMEELRLLSLEDPLMHIGNRRAMEVDLNFTQAEFKRHGKIYSLALLDIDFFKKYNDRYGHQEGDTALKQVAQVVKDELRSADRVYRYGGEELLVLMPETDALSAEKCIDRIRQTLEAKSITHQDSSFGVLTLSAGTSAGPNENWPKMVETADQALYQAKNSGRNKVCAAT